MDLVDMVRVELVDANSRFSSLNEDDKQRVAEIYAARIASADPSSPRTFEEVKRFNETVYAEFGV